ncbi:MAG: UbiA-like polyprenyltransferase [bacterium]
MLLPQKHNIMSLIIQKYRSRLAEYLELIKFEHTIFALPFALSGMLLAIPDGFPKINIFIWVMLAMLGGRTASMALNRIIDADIDKENFRTANRAIPSGSIKKISAFILALLSFGVLIFAVWHLPLICRQLLPIAIVILAFYSYTKRFTILTHLILGSALGSASAGGWLAVSGTITLPVVIWGLAIVFWVAGFDIIYAIQDIEFDKKNKLFSIPAKFGIEISLFISKIFHIITVILLIILGKIWGIGYFYWIGLVFAGFMLIYEHSLINKNDLSKINVAFFNINGYVSIGIFLFILLDKVL